MDERTGADLRRELREQKELLLTMLRLARMNSWEWNLKTRELRLINAADAETMGRISPLMAAETAVIPHYPEILLLKGMIEGSAEEMLANDTRMIYTAKNGEEVSFRLPFLTTDHETVWLHFTGVVYRDENDLPDRAIGYYANITSQLESARAYSAEDILKVEREKQNYMMMIDGLTADYANVLFVDLARDSYTPFRINEVTDRLLHDELNRVLSYRELMSLYIDRFVYEEDRELLSCLVDPDRLRALLRENRYFNINYRSERLGELVYCQVKAACGTERDPDSVVLGIRNIDEEYRKRQALLLESRTDSLTGLLNKRALWEDVKNSLYNGGSNIAFVFLDLDHFKEVNDRLGHAVGDRAIAEAAKVLRKVFRRSDIIGRFGGDEFCVFLSDIPKEVAARRIEQCLAGLRLTFTNEGKSVRVTSSIGTVYYDSFDSTDVQRLIAEADAALYEAKRTGRDRSVMTVHGKV